MTHRPCAFKKSRIALGLAAMVLGTSSAHAASWDFGDVSITLDSTFTLATSIRTEDRDLNLIGKSNQAQFNLQGYNAATNVIYPSADFWASEIGGYSNNGDLGNLAHDPGDAFSTQIAGTHELDINAGDYGFFTRAFWFYDFEQKDGDRPWANKISGETVDLCSDPIASERLCSDFRILDAFFYADLWVGDMPLSLRVGEQVISWGESTFIQHGINTANPVDVTRARAPGAELKEVFLPVGTIFASLGITENASISAYYQYEWQESWLPVSGSYFATNDFAGAGGQAQNVQLGFSGNPDIDLDTLLQQINGLGDALRAGANPATISQAYLAYPTKLTVRANGDAALKAADDQGQYGIRFTYFAEELNQSELSFYLINYHSKAPLISGVTSDFTAAGIGRDIATLASTQITKDNITDLQAFSEAQFFFPEDIKLYGFSFNTNVGTTAVAGEVSYRKDEPLQIDDVELLYMAMPEQLANAGLRPDLAGISQLNNIGRTVGPGETANGFVFSDTMQIQATVSHVFGPVLGTDNLVLLGEAGYVDVLDFPDPSVLRLNSPGTVRTASLEPLRDSNGNILSTREGLHVGLSDGPETNPFATEDAWGYRLLAIADFNNIYRGVNLRARATFSHDVDGITPDPIFLFVEDRKSANISFTFDYLSKWSATASYSAFWGGVGSTNALADRDFISFNIKYSI